MDGDGYNDIVGGAYRESFVGVVNQGAVYVFSGQTGAVLHKFVDPSAHFFGWSVAGAGDINGDGRSDLIVGSPFADPGPSSNAGSAWAFSGADGSTLHRWDGVSDNDGLGVVVAGAGDLNGDGLADVLVSATGVDHFGFTASGSAYVFSSKAFMYSDAPTVSASSGGWSTHPADGGLLRERHVPRLLPCSEHGNARLSRCLGQGER